MHNPQGHQDGDTPSLGTLVERLINDGRDMLSAEAKLAVAHAERRAVLALRPLGMFAGAVVVALIALVAVHVGIAAALAPLIGVAPALLLVAALASVEAFVLLRAGKAALARALDQDGPERNYTEGSRDDEIEDY